LATVNNIDPSSESKINNRQIRMLGKAGTGRVHLLNGSLFKYTARQGDYFLEKASGLQLEVTMASAGLIKERQ